uniref:Uncharacterized protein n=1 Tax=Tanacetum cinerariifolium TaxID=118510 RepID=A0A6L2M4M7_TANCI|nr:hypothetical protein [Tanacetum cinerariifolium]
MACTTLGEMADQTVMRSVHNSDHGDFASGYLCGRSLKLSDASALVSPTPIINMSRDVLIKDIEAANHKELLSGMTNNMREAAMDALSVSMHDNPGSYISAAGGSRPKPSAAGGSKLDPIWVKIHDVPIQFFLEDGLSIIASQIVNAKDVLIESLTIGVHLIEDTGFTMKTVSTIEYE